MRRVQFSILICFVTSVICVSARSAPSDCVALARSLKANIDNVQAAIDSARVADQIPGITYAIFTDTCLITKGTSGSASMKGGPLHAGRTLFRLGSVSKFFTTMALSQLFEQGIFDGDTKLMDLVDADIVQYILDHETPDRIASWSKIRLKHLMCHQSGISKDLPGALAFFNTESLGNNSYPSFSDLYSGITKTEFLFEPGSISTGMKYSNLEKNILARIVGAYNPEQLSFRRYVAEHVLRPLGMSHTFYDIPDDQVANMVQGYGVLQNGQDRTLVPLALNVGSYDGSIGIASTSGDLAKLGREFLKLMSDKSILLHDHDLISYFVTPVSPSDQTLAWGHGPEWDVLPGESAATDPIWVGNEGTGASERATVLVSPEKNLGVVLLFNAVDAYREKYVKIISDLIPSQSTGMNAAAKGRIDAARSFLVNTPSPAFITPPKYPHPGELAKYVGNYYADIVGNQLISLSDDGYLVLNGQKLMVEDASAGRFRYPPIPGPDGILYSSEPIVFSFDKVGSPVSHRMAQVYIFRKVK